jgi:hypothetical protein
MQNIPLTIVSCYICTSYRSRELPPLFIFHEYEVSLRWQISGLQLSVVSLKQTEVSQVRITSFITGIYRNDDGGNIHLWNVCQLLIGYTAFYPIILSPSYSMPREPEISPDVAYLYVRLDFQSSLSSTDSPTTVFYALLLAFLHATYTSILFSVDSVTLIIPSEELNTSQTQLCR